MEMPATDITASTRKQYDNTNRHVQADQLQIGRRAISHRAGVRMSVRHAREVRQKAEDLINLICCNACMIASTVINARQERL